MPKTGSSECVPKQTPAHILSPAGGTVRTLQARAYTHASSCKATLRWVAVARCESSALLVPTYISTSRSLVVCTSGIYLGDITHASPSGITHVLPLHVSFYLFRSLSTPSFTLKGCAMLEIDLHS